MIDHPDLASAAVRRAQRLLGPGASTQQVFQTAADMHARSSVQRGARALSAVTDPSRLPAAGAILNPQSQIASVDELAALPASVRQGALGRIAGVFPSGAPYTGPASQAFMDAQPRYLPATIGQVGSNLAPIPGLYQGGVVTAGDIARSGQAGFARYAASQAPQLEAGLAQTVAPSAFQAAASRAATAAAGTSGILPFAQAATAEPSALSLLSGVGSTAGDAARTAELRALASQSAGLVAPLEAGALGAAEAAAPAGLLAASGGVRGLAVRGAGAFGLYTGGQMLGGALDNANVGGDNSDWDRALRSGATGAGIGAGLGLLGGPFAPVSTPVAAAIGGALGLAGGALAGLKFGDKETGAQVHDKFSKALTASGLPAEDVTALQSQYELLADGKGAAGARKIADELKMQATQLITVRQQEQQQQARSAALQTQLTPLFRPYLDAAAAGAAQSYRQASLAADQVDDPQLQAIFRAQAANRQAQALQSTAGYAAQIANPELALQLSQLGGYSGRVTSALDSLLARQQAKQIVGTGTNSTGAQSLAALLGQ